MWSQIEVDLGGTLSWSAFIAGLRCTLIKQHSVSAQPMKDVSIWQAGRETQPVIKPAGVQFVSSGLITGLRSKEHYHLQLTQQVQIGGKHGGFRVYSRLRMFGNPTFSERCDSFLNARQTRGNQELDRTETSVIQTGQVAASWRVVAGGVWAEQ